VAPFGCGVDIVHIYAHTEGRPGQFLGPAAYGEPNAALESTSGRRFTRCGWSFVIKGLTPGAYTLTVFPHDTVSVSFTDAAVIGVTVR
jgi:hypothetical protein